MKSPYFSEKDKEVQGLEKMLDQAYRTILHLLPKPFQDAFHKTLWADSRQEMHSRLDEAIDLVIEQANVRTDRFGNNSIIFEEQHAYCPLCGDGSSSAYADGFKYPEGLRRHLTGWGNNWRCCVVEAMSKHALLYNRDKFNHVEANRQQERASHIKARRLTETLYQVSVIGEPKLFDDLSFVTARNADDFSNAEDRLKVLGFSLQYIQIKSNPIL
jgi:hypothetical protein